MNDRYVIIALARARAVWFNNLSLWANAGAIPVEICKSLSVGELEQRLDDLRPYSAVLVEAGVAGVDRDLIDLARRRNIPTIVVNTNSGASDEWIAAGAAAVLHGEFTSHELVFTLSTNANIVHSTPDSDAITHIEEAFSGRGALVAVCGPGGTGTSTAAIAIAQGLAAEVMHADLVALVDFARNAEQAMLHDAGDVFPGVSELVEMNRTKRADIESIHGLLFAVNERGYRLLLGMRRVAAWSAMPPRAIETAILSLQRSFRVIVADITADFEGENDGGSIDVEERNGLARTSLHNADVVVAIGAPGLKGTHALARTIREIMAQGVPGEKIVSVVNRAPRRGAMRAEISQTLAALISQDDASAVAAPIFLEDHSIDAALRDGIALPKKFVTPLTSAVSLRLNNAQSSALSVIQPSLVIPGSLGTTDKAVGE